MKKIKKISAIFASLLVAAWCSLGLVGNAFAGAFGVSPMSEKIALTPGETYYGSLTVSNPASSDSDFTFETSVEPFFAVDGTDNIKYETEGNYNQMVNWITVLDTSGTVAPNGTKIVHYRIDVPLDAPAGGQYATIIIQSVGSTPVEGAINIQQQVRIAYLIYAEIAGETVHDGEIKSAEVPGFLLSGNIEGTSLIENKGNVHAGATYALQVFPIFSNEEIYTNEEDPDTALIMPEATRLKTTAWDKTPDVGIFNVKYTVEFEGITQTVEKMVIKCPIWLLFIIIFAVIFLIFWLVMKSKSRKKSQR